MTNSPWPPKPSPKDKNWKDWLNDIARKNAGIGDFSGVNGPDALNSKYTHNPVNISDSINGPMAGEAARNGNTPYGNPSNGGGSFSNGGSPFSSIEKAYADLIARLKGVGVDNSALIDQSIGAVKGNYSAADSDIYKQYMNARDDLTGRAGNLGVDYDNSKMGQDWDTALRRIQEMSNSNLNSDLSYFEKMRSLKQSAVEAMILGAEQEKAQKIAQARAAMRAAAASKANALKASETQTLENVGDVEIYNSLKKTNPTAAQIYYNAYWGNKGDPASAIADLMKQKSTPGTNYVRNDMPEIFKTVAGARESYNKNQYKAMPEAIAALQLLSKLWGNPGITQKVTT